jgi:hypothetical protein
MEIRFGRLVLAHFGHLDHRLLGLETEVLITFFSVHVLLTGTGEGWRHVISFELSFIHGVVLEVDDFLLFGSDAVK